MIFWPRCFAQTPIFQAVRKVALILTMSIDVYLVSVALAKDDTEYNEEVMSPKSDAAMDPRFLLRSWRAWTENKNSLFVIVFLAACSVLIFSDVALAHFESAQRHVVYFVFLLFCFFFPIYPFLQDSGVEVYGLDDQTMDSLSKVIYLVLQNNSNSRRALIGHRTILHERM